MARDLGVEFNATPTQQPQKLSGADRLNQSSAILSRSQAARTEIFRQQAAEAQKAAELAAQPGTIAIETAKGTVNQLFSGPLRAVKSLVQAPVDIARSAMGIGIDTSAGKDIMGNPMQSYQGAIASGKPVLPELGQAALDVASVLPVGKGMQAIKPALGKAGEVLSRVTSPITKPIASFLAQRAEKKAIDTALKSVTPKTKDLTVDEYEKLLSQKRITPKEGMKPSQYVHTEREKAAATKYKDILQDKDPVKNTISIRDKIAEEDAAVGAFLEKNNGIFNSGELKNFLSKEMEDVSDVMIPEERIAKLKDQITTNFLASLKKNDMKSLWERRKEFDQEIEKAFSGSPTLTKEVKKKFRNAVQEYISEHTPDSVYKSKMKDMTDLFNLEDIVQTKATKEKGLTAFEVWIKENPTKAKVIGAGAGLVGAGAAWNITQ